MRPLWKLEEIAEAAYDDAMDMGLSESECQDAYDRAWRDAVLEDEDAEEWHAEVIADIREEMRLG